MSFAPELEEEVTCCLPCENVSFEVKDACSEGEIEEFKVIFLGTGVSTAIPSIGHVLDKRQPCVVCHHAIHVKESRNRRNNVSIALSYREKSTGVQRCLVVDAGKTLRDACLQTLSHDDHHIDGVHALLITHGHADAIMGLDDVRDLQRAQRVEVVDPHHSDGRTAFGFEILSGKMPIFATQETMTTICNTFPYLSPSNPVPYLDESRNILERRVALLDLQSISEWQSLSVFEMPIQCFPVYHGGQYVSLGFHFGARGEFVYISDVKIIPAETWAYLQSLSGIRVLVIDALDRDGIWSHCSLSEAIDFAQRLKAERVYFTGISCGLGLHDDVNRELDSLYGSDYQLAFDGLVITGLKMR